MPHGGKRFAVGYVALPLGVQQRSLLDQAPQVAQVNQQIGKRHVPKRALEAVRPEAVEVQIL